MDKVDLNAGSIVPSGVSEDAERCDALLNLNERQRRWVASRYEEIERGTVAETLDRLGLDVKDRVVLDLGCGAGQWLIEVSGREPAHLIGLDLDTRWLEIARVELKLRRLCYVDLVNSTAVALPLATGSCDVIICRSVLQYLEDDFCGLREMLRVLKPGGQILLEWHAWGYYLHKLLHDKGPRAKLYRMKSLISGIVYLITGRKYFRDTFQLRSRVEDFLSFNGARIDARETDYYGWLPGFHRVIGSSAALPAGAGTAK